MVRRSTAVQSQEARRSGRSEILALGLRQLLILSPLPDAELQEVASAAELVDFEAGHLLMEEGRPSDCAYILLRGEAAVFREGVEVARRGPGDCLGELSLIDGQDRSATVRAVGKLSAVWLCKGAFEILLGGHAALAKSLLRAMATKLRESPQGQAAALQSRNELAEALSRFDEELEAKAQPGAQPCPARSCLFSADCRRVSSHHAKHAMKPIRILIADKHALFRTSLKALLALDSDLLVVAEASNGQETLEMISFHHPDVVLMGLAIREPGGLDATEHAKSVSPGTRVVVVATDSAEEYVLRALRAGAVGYVSKECGVAELTAAVRTAANGGVCISPSVLTERVVACADTPNLVSLPLDALTPRRREILRLLAQGHAVKAAAYKLGISPKTADALRARLMKQLGIRNLPELLRLAIRSGLVEPEP